MEADLRAMICPGLEGLTLTKVQHPEEVFLLVGAWIMCVARLRGDMSRCFPAAAV